MIRPQIAPPALHPLEMLDAVPAAVAPGPGAALGAKYKHPDETEAGNEREQRDVGLVADTPDPIEKERAPIPAPDFRRNDFWGRHARPSRSSSNPVCDLGMSRSVV